MAWLIHIVSLRGACLTDYVGLWSFHLLFHFRGIAPSGEIMAFNAWMVFTSAAEWMVVGGVLRLLMKLARRKGFLASLGTFKSD